MYVKVVDIVPKCTEKSEGILLYEHCINQVAGGEMIILDFFGIQNVTDDFLFALLGAIYNEKSNTEIHYVRTQTYIKTRFKRAYKRIFAAS